MKYKIIKGSKKRRQFERILKKLGYRDQSPIFLIDLTKKEYHRKLEKLLKIHKCTYNPLIFKNNKKIEQQILEEISRNSYKIIYFTIPYWNKKTYLYCFFIENYEKFSKKEMIKELKILCKNILYHEKTRLCEVGWGIINSNALYFANSEYLKKIYFEIIKKGKREFSTGDNNFKPRPGDILVSKPVGGKFIGSNNQHKFLLAQKQRSKINKKFGFGDLKEHESQYGRYDSNLILKPI